MIPAAIHVDLDGAKHVFQVHGRTWPRDDDPLFDSGLKNFLELFDRLGLKATLFVIAEDLEDSAKLALLREAVARGHEIASHSMTHRKLGTLDRHERRHELAESRALIAELLGTEPAGFRAPCFDTDREVLELLDETGYAWDSSVFPDDRFRARLGVADVPRVPHIPLEGRGLQELPMPGYRGLPFPFHPSYGLVLGMWYFRLGLAQFRRTGAPLVLLFHLTDLAEPLPAGTLPGLSARVFTLSHLSVAHKRRWCERALGFVARDYRIGPTSALIEAT